MNTGKLLWLLLTSMTLWAQAGSSAGRGFFGVVGSSWKAAKQQAAREQLVEDCNVPQRVRGEISQRLIMLPIDESFVAAKHNSLYGKIQCSDKCSFPKSIGSLLLSKPHESPWLFEIKPVESKSVGNGMVSASSQSFSPKPNVAYVSPLDFRSPENFMFAPSWVMKKLNISSHGLVNVRFVQMKLAAMVVLQPTSKNWLQLAASEGREVHNILEREINRFSSLTADSDFAILHKGISYGFHVNKTISEDNISVWGVRIQDSDVRVEIDNSLLSFVNI